MGWIVVVCTIAFLVFMYRSTYYIIEKNELTIRSMLIVHKKIQVDTITKIYKTRNPLSSPALSINRIAIVYNKYDEILISPLDRKQFIEELAAINSEITIEV